MHNNQLKEYFNKKQFRIQLIGMVLFLLISCSIIFLLQKKETINLLDSKEYQLEAFTDVWDQGDSKSTILSRTKNEITYRCCLGEGTIYPYAGVQIRKTDSTFYSLKNYKMKMQIVTQKRQRLPIRIYNFREGLSNAVDIHTLANSLLLYQNIYTIEKGENDLEVAFNDFTKTPEWWYIETKINESDIKSWDVDHVVRLSIFSDPGYPVHEERTFKITRLLLVGDYSNLYILLAIFVVVVLVLFFSIHILLYQKQKRIQLTIKYSDDFDFEPKETDLKSQIHTFIAEHYSNSELKSGDLATYLQVPEYKIGEILKDNVGMSFKSFLNNTRVEAAKQYLKDSSYSISEIAYKTGFNSPSSFNRVFKEIVNQAPGEFRS